MKEPCLPREVERECADHEVFMSFQNDSDAILFREWFAVKGWPAFKKWSEETIKRRGDE